MRGAQREDALRYIVGAAVIATAVSITAFEFLMALAFVGLVVTRTRLRIPPFWAPLALFLLGTLVSLAASGHIRDGLPQVWKFYVYAMLFLVTSTFENVRQIRTIVLAWSLAAVVAAAWGLLQFARKYEYAQNTGRAFYSYYVLSRITGFTNHWMTFGGQMMIALLLIAAIVLFATDRRYAAWLAAATVPISAALIETWTRSMWLAAFCGGVYLIWFWKRWALLVAPLVIAAILFANPFDLRERALSAFSPHGAVDSNAHRAELRAIGWKMIKAHPWLGVGPEQVAREVENYLPPGATPQAGEYYGHLENDYIQYAAERGVPTMLALMWMIAWALLDFARALRRLPAGADERWVLHAAVAVTIGVLVGGLYSWNLNASYVLAMYMAVLGMGYVASLKA
jgi:putative inorganic carbon (hco3(-)) transporter